MEYKLGNSSLLREIGITNTLVCPKCNNEVKLTVFRNRDKHIDEKAKIPYLKFNKVYCAVCPNCAGIFSVINEHGKAFEKGDKDAVSNFILGNLEEFK